MWDVKFHQLDLNLLRVFSAVFQHKSVTAAATQLCISQSAVSHALARLRQGLGDELFVRTANGIYPTDFALDIGPRLLESLTQVENALCPAQFDPRTSKRTFRLSMLTYISTVLVPKLIVPFHEQAPGCEIDILPRTGTMIQDLDSGYLDMVLDRFALQPKRIAVDHLFTDPWVWVARADNPHITDSTGPGELARLPRVHLKYSEGSEPLETFAIPGPDLSSGTNESRDNHTQIVLHAPDSMAAISAAARSDLVTLVPRRLAASLQGYYDIRLYPSAGPPEIQFKIAWHRAYENNAGLVWLRNLIREVISADQHAI